MKKQQNRFLAFMLVFILFLSGMCMDSISTDSFLAFQQFSSMISHNIDSTEGSFLIAEDISNPSTACTEELISQRTVINMLQRTRRLSERVYSKTDLGLSFVDFLPQVSLLSFITIASNVPEEPISNAVIVGFIHHKDGQKA